MTHIDTSPEAVALLPCPFCGGELWIGEIQKPDSDDGWVTCGFEPSCLDCKAQMEPQLTKAAAVAAWNRRDPALVAERDALRAEVERLAAIIRRMDQVIPRADQTCDDPGITLSEAVQRETPSLRCAALQHKAGE